MNCSSGSAIMNSQSVLECNSDSDCDLSQSDNDEADLYDIDFDEEFLGDIDYKINPLLMQDMDLLKENCPDSFVSHRSFCGINEIDVDMTFPTFDLEKSVAKAWGLVYGKPIIIRLCIDQHLYLDALGVNAVEVFQTENSKKFGVLMQLKLIVEAFCRKQFCELTNEKLKAALEENSPEPRNVPDDSTLELIEMGFNQEDIILASRLSNGTKEGAVNFLIKQQKFDFATSHGSHYSEEGVSLAAAMEEEEQRTSPDSPHIAKMIPSLSKGFLVQLYVYTEQRLLTLNSFCPICDNPHTSAICMMLKPVVCSSPLCIFSYQTLGVMADTAIAIVSEPEVVSLLVTLTIAAAKSSRHEIIFTPYPTIVHPSMNSEMAMCPENKDFELLKTVLQKISHVQEMQKYNETVLQATLNEKHELCYPLLKWIISSNRSHIVKLVPNMQLRFMGTQHQFLMRNSPPLEDKQFRIYKKEYGSIFAFHGSPIENWHSIIREGLIVASGTKKMMNGAAYGNGIYLSPHLATSLSYSNKYKVLNERPETKKNDPAKKISYNYFQGSAEDLICIALCEVIDSPNLKKFGNIWTCDKSEYVCTRFFFVYDSDNLTTAACWDTSTTKETIHKQVEKAIQDALELA